jgi:hypothetical protein
MAIQQFINRLHGHSDPTFLTLSMLITNFYTEITKKTEYNAMGLGLLCLIFLMGSNYYQFQKFTAGTDLSIDFIAWR